MYKKIVWFLCYIAVVSKLSTYLFVYLFGWGGVTEAMDSGGPYNTSFLFFLSMTLLQWWMRRGLSNDSVKVAYVVPGLLIAQSWLPNKFASPHIRLYLTMSLCLLCYIIMLFTCALLISSIRFFFFQCINKRWRDEREIRPQPRLRQTDRR